MPVTQLLALPATSSARKRISVSPSAETLSEEPAVAVDQLAPASVEVSYSYPSRPESASVDPATETVTEAALCHDGEPPATNGVLGGVRSVNVRPRMCPTDGDAKPGRARARWRRMPWCTSTDEAPVEPPT